MTLGYSDWSGEWADLVKHHMIPGEPESIVHITREEHARYHQVAVKVPKQSWPDMVSGMLRRAGYDAQTDGRRVWVPEMQRVWSEKPEEEVDLQLQGYESVPVDRDNATPAVMDMLIYEGTDWLLREPVDPVEK